MLCYQHSPTAVLSYFFGAIYNEFCGELSSETAPQPRSSADGSLMSLRLGVLYGLVPELGHIGSHKLYIYIFDLGFIHQ